ncbi:MAG: hypothetical protein NZ578_11360 [Candidatus Binatia bacterium]|nr:hypothetical protein [Candidatus Binatia bacterium]
MADRRDPGTTQQHLSSPANAQPDGQSGETHLTLVAKAIFWLLLLPVGLLLLVRWVLQSGWLQP